MPPTRHFLGWHQPILKLGTDHLTGGWEGGPLDLSDLLVVVPTRQSARRLREQLAAIAAKRQTGVLPPLTVPPEYFIASSGVSPISRAESLVLMADVLLKLEPRRLPNLFPAQVQTASADLHWALGAAEQLCDLRTLLAETSLSISDAAARLAEAFADSDRHGPDRWQEMEMVETHYLDRLEKLGLNDATLLRQQAPQAFTLPAGIRRILLIGVPDPTPLAIAILENLAETVPVEVCIHAPQDLEDCFDDWGRPNEDSWTGRPIQIRDEHVVLVPKPQDQARQVVKLLDAGLPVGDLAVGVPDEEVTPHLERELNQRALKAFNPAGRPVAGHAFFHLLTQIGRLLATDSYEAASALLRNPDLLDYLTAKQTNATLDTARLLRQLDKLQNAHLPPTFAALRRWSQQASKDGRMTELAAAVAELDQLLRPLNAPGFVKSIFQTLETIYANRTLNPSVERDRDFVQVATALCEPLFQLDSPLIESIVDSAAARADLMIRLLGRVRIYPEQTGNHPDIDLEGWLELHWNDAPHLILTGFNEGRIPDSVVGHPFLPDLARRALGLSHNSRRLARDAYLLSAMLASRNHEGSLCRIVLGKTSARNDVIKPSRLLFFCPDDILAERVQRLFGEVHQTADTPPWNRAWKLCPQARPAPDHLSVTAFRDYLQCPFRFYLKRVLGMTPLNDRKAELDSMDFGNICHQALEQFAKDQSIRNSADTAEIADYLSAQADMLARTTFGPAIPTAVFIQLESVKQRLRAAARVQADLRAQGWQILHAEYKLGDGHGVDFHGIRLKGVVDRIDRHANGLVRILDYKTFDTPKSPQDTHLASLPTALADQFPAGHWARWDLTNSKGKTKPMLWRDLQLPLYLTLLRDRFGPEIQCGYFVLPKAVSDTKIDLWQPLPWDLIQACETCAAGVIQAIASGVFWPPSESVHFDDFESLFFHGAADSVDSSFVNGEP